MTCRLGWKWESGSSRKNNLRIQQMWAIEKNPRIFVFLSKFSLRMKLPNVAHCRVWPNLGIPSVVLCIMLRPQVLKLHPYRIQIPWGFSILLEYERITTAVSSLNLPLLCKDSFVIPTHKLYPFFDRKRRLKIVANENYNRVEHRVDWHLALCPIVSCALKRPLSRTMSPKRYKHEQKMPATIHCQKHLKREPSEQFSCFFRPSY